MHEIDEINGKYKIVVCNYRNNTEIITAGCFGDEVCAIHLRNLLNNINVSIYFGTSDPPSYWKGTFDFNLSKDSLEYLYNQVPHIKMVNVWSKCVNDDLVKSVMYIMTIAGDQLLKIESRFVDKSDVIWNLSVSSSIRFKRKRQLIRIHDLYVSSLELEFLNENK